MHQVLCIVCGKTFSSVKKTSVCCSNECKSKRISQVQTKVTEESVDLILKLREEGVELIDICYEAKLSKTTVCSVLAAFNAKLTSEQRSQKMKDRWDKVERYDELGRLQCSKCHERKSPEEFSANKQNPTGRRHSCKACDKLVDSLRWEKKRKERKAQKSPSEEGPNS